MSVSEGKGAAILPSYPEIPRGFWSGFNLQKVFVSQHIREKFFKLRGGNPDTNNRSLSGLLSKCTEDFRSPGDKTTNTRWRSEIWVPPVPGQTYDHLCFTVASFGLFCVVQDIEPHEDHLLFPIEEFVMDDFFGASLYVTRQAIEQFIGYWPIWPHVPKRMRKVREVMRGHARSATPSSQSPEHFDVEGSLRFVVITDQEDGERKLVTVERRKEASK